MKETAPHGYLPPGFGPPFEWDHNGESFVVYRAGFVVAEGEECIPLFAFSTLQRPRIFEVLTQEEIDESFGDGAIDSVQAASRNIVRLYERSAQLKARLRSSRAPDVRW